MKITGVHSILLIASISSVTAAEQKVHYCVSKAGVNMLTEGCALEWGPHAIRVNTVGPGDIDTGDAEDA